MKTRVKGVMAQVFGVAPDEIQDESSPETIQAWDSLSHLNLVMALEEEFAIRFLDDQIVDLLSCGGIVMAVAELSGPHGMHP